MFETESIDDLGKHESVRQNLMMAVKLIKMNLEREEDNQININENQYYLLKEMSNCLPNS